MMNHPLRKSPNLTVVTVKEKCFKCLAYEKITSSNCVDGKLASSNCPKCGKIVSKIILTEGD